MMPAEEVDEGFAEAKLTVCVCLGMIESKKLYRQAGARSFKQYLTMKRIAVAAGNAAVAT